MKLKKSVNLRKKLIVQWVVSSMFAMTAHNAFADTTDLGTVTGSASDASAVAADQASAAYQAPTQGSLVATQPETVISQHYIQENMGPAANFPDIVAISPSVWSVDPNGTGGMESQAGGPFLRGFKAGQYNVTFDGIPWGDSNDFTQHSTVYFMPQDLSSVVVDRGPGDASTIGNATFGGTMASYSRAPSTTSDFTTFSDIGSFDTHLVGASFDTGVMKQYGDASAFVSYKDFGTQGYLTNVNQRRTNLFVKLVKPISDNTVLTFVAMQNYTHQNFSSGTTLADLQTYGNNYGLNENPNSQNYQAYNTDNINSDFEYIGLQSNWSGWKVDNKLYTYAYEHNGMGGTDQSSAAINGTVLADGAANPNGVPGYTMTMDYRSVGDVFRLARDVGPGTVNTGIWYDHQLNSRSNYNVDLSTGGYNYINTTSTGAGVYTNWLMNDTLTSVQPYLDYAWKVNNALTITPGLKYASFNRTLNAAINNVPGGLPYNGSATWDAMLPSIDAHYSIQSDWSAYAQLAKGFQAPNLNSFYNINPDLSTLTPQSTTNYQMGTTYTSDAFTLAADVYLVQFGNLIQNGSTVNGISSFYNAGGADYKGVEMEGTYHLGDGYNLYSNYSLNYANLNNSGATNGQWLANAPQHTGVIGVIYGKGPVYASLLTKYVGQRYGDNGQTIPLGAYSVTNLNVSYTLPHFASWAKAAEIGVQMSNLFDNQQIFALAGYNGVGNANGGNGDAMYFTLPGRSAMLNLTIHM